MRKKTSCVSVLHLCSSREQTAPAHRWKCHEVSSPLDVKRVEVTRLLRSSSATPTAATSRCLSHSHCGEMRLLSNWWQWFRVSSSMVMWSNVVWCSLALWLNELVYSTRWGCFFLCAQKMMRLSRLQSSSTLEQLASTGSSEKEKSFFNYGRISSWWRSAAVHHE